MIVQVIAFGFWTIWIKIVIREESSVHKNTKNTYGAGIISMITEIEKNNIGDHGKVCHN